MEFTRLAGNRALFQFQYPDIDLGKFGTRMLIDDLTQELDAALLCGYKSNEKQGK